MESRGDSFMEDHLLIPEVKASVTLPSRTGSYLVVSGEKLQGKM